MSLTKIVLLALAGALVSCGSPSTSDHAHDSHGSDTSSAIVALYDQVMDIHDEVMPKISDLYKLKKKLQDEIAASPQMVVEKKKELERRIIRLDSVSQLMMDWMHEFEPLPDSVDQELARDYLELQMEKIMKVKTAMLEIIQQETIN